MDYEVKEFLFSELDTVKNAWFKLGHDENEEQFGKYQKIIIACGLRMTSDEFDKYIVEKEITITQGKDLFFETLEKNHPFFKTYSKEYLERMLKFLKSVLPEEIYSRLSQPVE